MRNPDQVKGVRPWALLATTFVIALLLLPPLAGCSPEQPTGSNPTVVESPGKADDRAQVVGATYVRAHETSETFLICGADAQRLYDAYLQGVVGDRVEICATDYDDTVTFELADGSRETVRFNARNLQEGDSYRSFSDGGGFWDLLGNLALDEVDPTE